jgi:hypothetical protein
MNPYEASATPFVPSSKGSSSRPIGPLLIAIVLAVAAIAGIVSMFIPYIASVTRPRFGMIELILCLNPLIFLLTWVWRQKRIDLMASAFITFALGVINAVTLIRQGTVSIVMNEFHDRLHSSWLWCVLTFVSAGIYLSWVSLSGRSNSRVVIMGEQSVEPELPITTSHKAS